MEQMDMELRRFAKVPFRCKNYVFLYCSPYAQNENEMQPFDEVYEKYQSN